MVTLKLQKKGCTGIRLQMGTGRANSGSDSGKSNSESPFYRCKLGEHYIDPNAAIVKYPEFESGVQKFNEARCFCRRKKKKGLQKGATG